MKTVRTTLQLLKQFSLAEGQLGVSALARRLGVDRASAHRMLRSLMAEGAVEQDPRTRLYALGPAIADLAAARRGDGGLVAVARPHLERLRDRTGEGAALIRTDGVSGICLTMVPCTNTVRVVYHVGERIPLHCTASGHVLLADMAEAALAAVIDRGLPGYSAGTITDGAALRRELAAVAAAQVAYTSDSYLAGISSIAAGIRPGGGRVAAAVALAIPAFRLPPDILPERQAATLACARAIGEALASG